MNDLKIHPAAELFPPMTEKEFQEFKEDIAVNGLREPIVYWNGMLLDGRNRLKACEELGIEPQDCELDADFDPWAYAISHNLHRRHLDTSQRATVAEELANKKHGGNRVSEQETNLSLEDAAEQLNVSVGSIKNARKVRELGSDDVRRSVKEGKIPVSVAAELVKKIPDKAKQSEIVAKGPKAVREAVKLISNSSESAKEKTPDLLPGGYEPTLTDCVPARPLTEEERRQGISQVQRHVSTAIQYAKIAISNLERIQKDDPGKLEAFDFVRKWMKENE